MAGGAWRPIRRSLSTSSAATAISRRFCPCRRGSTPPATAANYKGTFVWAVLVAAVNSVVPSPLWQGSPAESQRGDAPASPHNNDPHPPQGGGEPTAYAATTRSKQKRTRSSLML